MGRRPCCSKEGMNRGTWTSMEDKVLTAYIKVHGEGHWRTLPKRAGLKRCGKSCRLRWLNYLRPDIKRGNISEDEEDLILRLHRLLGNRWSLIARRLPGRTDNEIKNYWNTNLRKRVRGRPLSSSPSPSSQTDKVTTEHQVIRTKATRCTRAVIPAPEAFNKAKSQEDHNVSSPEMNPIQPEECPYEEEPSCVVKTDQYRSHELQQMSCDLGFFNSMDAHDQVLLMDEPCFGDWVANSNSLDLESLAFLLDSSEWPLQENQP